jgi:hypothetical protein
MSKLMSVLGIVLLAVGAALALVGFVNPAQMNVYGLTMDTAAILLTGGILSVGLGGVIAALQGTPSVSTVVESEKPVAEVAAVVVTPPPPPSPPVERPKMQAPVVESAVAPDIASRVRFNPFARKTEAVVASVGTAAAVVVAEAAKVDDKPAAKSAVDDTIAALEQAKADIANAIGGVDTMADSKPEEPVDETADDAVEDDDESADGELYVVEEREIRGRPARILSDNTVEAETDEGWMRFENIEHLNEYLDAMGEPA